MDFALLDFSSEETNKVCLCGKTGNNYTFSHSFYDENFYALKLNVERQSGVCDQVIIMISEKFGNIEDFLNQDLCVYGSVRTYNKHNDDDTVSVKLFVFVDEINYIQPVSNHNNNVVEIIGVICRTSNKRTTPFGRKICNTIVGVNRKYNKSDYIPCIFWGRNADYISGLKVGTKIAIKGRLQSRKYIKNNQEMTTYELSVQSYSLLSNMVME